MTKTYIVSTFVFITITFTLVHGSSLFLVYNFASEC